MDAMNGHCDILEFDNEEPYYFEDCDVQELDDATMRKVLAEYVNDLNASEGKIQGILQNLQHFNPSIASKFVTKNSILPLLKFRLISKDTNPTSFIALRYSCAAQVEQGIKLKSSPSSALIKLPLSALASQATLRELRPAEAVWCNQVCISQTDMAEKAVFIGLIDGVCRSARTVCIGIDDGEIEAHEAMFLREYADHFASQLPSTQQQHGKDQQLLRNELQIPPLTS